MDSIYSDAEPAEIDAIPAKEAGFDLRLDAMIGVLRIEDVEGQEYRFALTPEMVRNLARTMPEV